MSDLLDPDVALQRVLESVPAPRSVELPLAEHETPWEWE